MKKKNDLFMVKKYTESVANPDIITALKEGNETAFRIVFDLYYTRLFNFSLQLLKDQTQAEEIIQDTFLNLWMNREKLKEDVPIAPYLYTITRRLTLNALRHISVSQSAIDQLKKKAEVMNNDTEETIMLNDLKRCVENGLIKLSPQQRLVFQMSRYENLNYDEIAEQLHISRNTVKNHLVAALKLLREHFDEAGIVYILHILFFWF